MHPRTPAEKPLPPTQDQEFLDLEMLLAMALDSDAPLIGLGRPGEQVGAGRIQTGDENWQEEFLRPSRAARLIVLIPSSRKATAWELNTILGNPGLLSKTVFIIPPAAPPKAGHGALHLLHFAAVRSFEANAGGKLFTMAVDSGRRIEMRTNGLAFRWDAVARRVSVSAPLIFYTRPSPVRFLLDLWLSRSTVVVSGWRPKRNLLRVARCEPQG